MDGKDRRGGHKEDEADVECQVDKQKFDSHAVGDNAFTRDVIGHRPCAGIISPAHFGKLVTRGDSFAVFSHQVFHGLLLRIACQVDVQLAQVRQIARGKPLGRQFVGDNQHGDQATHAAYLERLRDNLPRCG